MVFFHQTCNIRQQSRGEGYNSLNFLVSFTGFQQPLIIILSSNVKVHWLIRIKHNPKDLKQHLFVVSTTNQRITYLYYYIRITDTTLELSVFWPSDTESRINELRFSESISLSFKTRLASVTCFCGDVT